MHMTLEAIIEPGGRVRILENVKFGKPVRALITILENEQASDADTSEQAEQVPFSQWWRKRRRITGHFPEPGVDPRFDYLRERYQL